MIDWEIKNKKIKNVYIIICLIEIQWFQEYRATTDTSPTSNKINTVFSIMNGHAYHCNFTNTQWLIYFRYTKSHLLIYYTTAYVTYIK